MALDAALVGVTAEWLVSSIDGLVETHPSLSREWVGLILLPIVSFLPYYHNLASDFLLTIFRRSVTLPSTLQPSRSRSRIRSIYPSL